MGPRLGIYVVIPLILALVILMSYFQLFSTAGVALLIVAYIAVSLFTKRKFNKQRGKAIGSAQISASPSKE